MDELHELHDVPLPERGWWACTEPERPADEQACFDERCPACIHKMRLFIAARGHARLLDWTTGEWKDGLEILNAIES